MLTVGVDGRPGQTSFTFNATGFGAGCTPDGVSDPCAGRDCGVVDGIVCGACTGDLSCNLSGQCVVAPSDVCGDGVKTANEACDDGDTAGGDGCNASCTAVEGGFTCPTQGGNCTPICGDGLVRGGEACDDGNVANGDGCSSACVVEAGFSCSGQGQGSCATLSCAALHAAHPNVRSGSYLVDPDGSGGVGPISVFCDMETSGGGWMLIARGGSPCASRDVAVAGMVETTFSSRDQECFYLNDISVRALASGSSEVQLRAGIGLIGSNNAVTSTSATAIEALRNGGNWHNGATFSGWIFQNSCDPTGGGSITMRWPNMFHGCGIISATHWINNSLGHARTAEILDPLTSTWIR